MTTFSAATSGTSSGSAPRSTEQLRWKREETRNSVPSHRRTGETGPCPSSGHRPRDHPRTGGPLPPASRSHSPRFPPAGRKISPALPLHPCHFRPWPRLLGSPPSSPLSLMHVPASPPTPPDSSPSSDVFLLIYGSAHNPMSSSPGRLGHCGVRGHLPMSLRGGQDSSEPSPCPQTR